MKKILCGILCASACAAVASVEQVVSTVEVRAVNSGYTNTIVAIPGLDLGTGGELAISNLVKTTNLLAGDRLVAFSGDNYESWELNASGVWEKNSALITVDGNGNVSEREGTSASLMTLGVGSGIWLSRVASGASNAFYVYAQQPTSYSTTIPAADGTSLVGNPTQGNAAPNVDGCVNGDKILVPTSGMPKTYTYDGTSWKYRSGFTEKTGLPTIAAGTGFWYVKAGSNVVTISW